MGCQGEEKDAEGQVRKENEDKEEEQKEASWSALERAKSGRS